MKNYVQSEDLLDLAAPYQRNSGEMAKIGQILGVAQITLANAEVGPFKTTGVFDLVKIGSQAWTVGALVYWDDTNKRLTTVATGNLLAGTAVLAVGSAAGETTGRVRLNGSFKANEA